MATSKKKSYSPTPLFMVTFSVLLFLIGIVIGFKAGNSTQINGEIVLQTIPVHAVQPSPMMEKGTSAVNTQMMRK